VETITGQVVATDPDFDRWVTISQLGFWLRHPAALTAGKDRPEGLEDLAQFERLGQELAILEYDLSQCLNEFLAGYQILYQEPKALPLKKFSVVYHTDNFHVRVHKLIENVFLLLALLVGTMVRRKEDWKKAVKTGLHRLRFESIAEALRRFEEDARIRRAVEARNLFVHHYREDPKWPMLHPAARIREAVATDAVAEQVRKLTESGISIAMLPGGRMNSGRPSR
jgi:Cthe_2314-like HEPN